MTLKFEDIKVGDVLDTNSHFVLTVIAKSANRLVGEVGEEKDLFMFNELLNFCEYDEHEDAILNSIRITGYHQPKPTKESIENKFLGKKNAPSVFQWEWLHKEILQLPKDEIKILFDLGE